MLTFNEYCILAEEIFPDVKFPSFELEFGYEYYCCLNDGNIVGALKALKNLDANYYALIDGRLN